MNGISGGQILLIRGAGSGFGRTTAIELARAGHTVYASMRRDDLEGHPFTIYEISEGAPKVFAVE